MERKYLSGEFTPFESTGVSTETIKNARLLFNEKLSMFGSILPDFDINSSKEILSISPPFVTHLDLYDGETLVAENYLMGNLEIDTIPNFTEEMMPEIERKMLQQIKDNYGLSTLNIT